MKASEKKAKFFCENCGSEVPEKAKFCKKCGKFFASVRCPKCGETGSSSAFSNGCPACGYAGKQSHSDKTAGKKIGLAQRLFKPRPSAPRRKASVEEAYLPIWVYVLVVLILLGLVALLFQNMF